MRLPLLLCLPALVLGCAASDPLPGPPIQTYTQVPAGDPGSYQTSTSRGVMEVYLMPDKDTYTIWNGPSYLADKWGTVTLVGVAENGRVTITLGNDTLSARTGHAFPGTGIHVIASHAELGTALLRSRWKRMHVVVPRPSADDARQVDRLPGFAQARLQPNRQVYLATRSNVEELLISVNGGMLQETGRANPGDKIDLVMMDRVGSGAHWLVYLGPSEYGRLLFHEYRWFYDTTLDSKDLIVVSPYGEPPDDP